MDKHSSLEAGDNIPVSPHGSLGLLAYGYKGLLALRLARENTPQNGDIEPEEKQA